MVLEDRGRDYVLTKVGNAVKEIGLDERWKQPYNPMVNAGAIATISLIKGAGPTERRNRMLDMFR